jgi:hypothetical protein
MKKILARTGLVISALFFLAALVSHGVGSGSVRLTITSHLDSATYSH